MAVSGCEYRRPAAASAFLFLVLLALASGCTAPLTLFFSPSDEASITPDEIGMRHESISTAAADGRDAVHGWWLPARDAVGTVIYLHGKDGNAGSYLANVYWLPAAGFDLFMLEYPGYGQSAQLPTITRVQRNIADAITFAIARSPQQPVVILGQSLGASLAIYAAAHSDLRRKISGIAVEGAFGSYSEVAGETLYRRWDTLPLAVWAELVLSDKYDPLRSVRRLSPIPLLIVHGTQDRVVPLHHAEDLFAAAREPKSLLVLPGVEHIGAFHDQESRQALVSFFRRALALPDSASAPISRGPSPASPARRLLVRIRHFSSTLDTFGDERLAGRAAAAANKAFAAAGFSLSKDAPLTLAGKLKRWSRDGDAGDLRVSLRLIKADGAVFYAHHYTGSARCGPSELECFSAALEDAFGQAARETAMTELIDRYESELRAAPQ